jgi:anti-sigma factor RsiW
MLIHSHRRFRRVVTPYADGELDGRAARMLAEHLRACEGCSDDLAMVLAMKGSLYRLAAAEPPTLPPAVCGAGQRAWRGEPSLRPARRRYGSFPNLRSRMGVIRVTPRS